MSRSKTLSGRTFAVFFVFSVFIMVASFVAATAANFISYEQKAEQDLLSQVHTLRDSIESSSTPEEEIAAIERYPLFDVRCTLVAEDGSVLYDSEVPVGDLDNHANREEIVAALESGEGAVLRKSNTLGADALYAAVPVSDGGVLRLAETRTSLASFLGGMYVQLIVALVVIFVLSLIAARVVTRMVVKPLREIDLLHPLENDAYGEMRPVLARVDAQAHELVAQNEELKRAVDMRREFTGNVSHEMKSPLQVIGGYAELIEGGVVGPEDIPRFAGLIRRESEAMRDLVDDILTLSRLDEHQGLAFVSVDAGGVFQHAASRLSSRADQRRVAVTVECVGDCTVVADGVLLEQMAYNLIDNAISYSPEGEVVSVSVQRDEEAVTIKVSDHGEGIPDEFKERIFERFFRIDDSRARETGGTGLGLAIVKHAATECGGDVRVEDNAPKGSVFVAVFPAVQAG